MIFLRAGLSFGAARLHSRAAFDFDPYNGLFPPDAQYDRIDGALYALTSAPWKNNFRDGAVAQVLHDGRTTAMRGELVTDPVAVGELSRCCAQSYGPKRAQSMMGLKFRDGGIPSVEEFTDAARRERFVAVRFTPE